MPEICNPFEYIVHSHFAEDMESKDIFRKLRRYSGFGSFLLGDNFTWDALITFRKIAENEDDITTEIDNYDADVWKNNGIVRVKVIHENFNDGLRFVCKMTKKQFLDLYHYIWEEYESVLDPERHLESIHSELTTKSFLMVLAEMTHTQENIERPKPLFLPDEDDTPRLDILVTRLELENEHYDLKLANDNSVELLSSIKSFCYIRVIHTNYDDGQKFLYLLSKENLLNLLDLIDS